MSTSIQTAGGIEPSKTWARTKKYGSAVSAWLLAALFLASGLWKLSDLSGAAERMVQSLIPVQLSLAVAILAGTAETFTGVCLLIPRLRRWAAWLAAAMLVAFMIYIGVFYRRLLGDDCNCFPWIRRVVGPGFFAGDGAMLLLAMVGAWGARRSRGIKTAGIVLLAVAALACTGYGLAKARLSDVVAPLSITADGHPQSLHRGRVLLYFYDPECMHCLGVAKQMSHWDWAPARVIAIPTEEPQFAAAFLSDSGLKAGTSVDAAMLRRTFRFTDPPYAVALVSGRQVAAFNSGELDTAAFHDAMQRLGFIRGK